MTTLPTAQMGPNPWNPNRMDESNFKKLVAYIQREGFVLPVVVRKSGRDTYEIIDGEHRWRAAKQLGLKEIPAEVVAVDDRRARVLTINLNQLRGEHTPALTAQLLHELVETLSTEDIASQTPYTTPEIEDYLSLLQTSDTLLEAERRATENDRSRPRLIQVPCDHPHVVEEAIAAAQAASANQISRGAALELVCGAFLDQAKGSAGVDG